MRLSLPEPGPARTLRGPPRPLEPGSGSPRGLRAQLGAGSPQPPGASRSPPSSPELPRARHRSPVPHRRPRLPPAGAAPPRGQALDSAGLWPAVACCTAWPGSVWLSLAQFGSIWLGLVHRPSLHPWWHAGCAEGAWRWLWSPARSRCAGFLILNQAPAAKAGWRPPAGAMPWAQETSWKSEKFNIGEQKAFSKHPVPKEQARLCEAIRIF